MQNCVLHYYNTRSRKRQLISPKGLKKVTCGLIICVFVVVDINRTDIVHNATAHGELSLRCLTGHNASLIVTFLKQTMSFHWGNNENVDQQVYERIFID